MPTAKAVQPSITSAYFTASTPAMDTFTLTSSSAIGSSAEATTTADGRYTFSSASGPSLGDGKAATEIVRHDNVAGTDAIVTATSSGVIAASVNAPIYLGASTDGRYVLFESNATELAGSHTVYNGDTGPDPRLYYVKDMTTGALLSVTGPAGLTDQDFGPVEGSIASDGKTVTLVTAASLVSSDTNNADDVYQVNLDALRASNAPAALHLDIANPGKGAISVSIDGSATIAPVIATGNGATVSVDLPLSSLTGFSGGLTAHVTDAAGHSTTSSLNVFSASAAPIKVYSDAHGRENHGETLAPVITADGHHIAFTAQQDPSQDTYVPEQVMIEDLTTHIVSLVSTSAAGIVGDDDSFNPHVSADGRHVEFTSTSDNLATIPSTAHQDPTGGYIYSKDMLTGAISQIDNYTIAANGQVATDGTSVSYTVSEWIDENRSNVHTQTQDIYVTAPATHSLIGGSGSDLLLGSSAHDLLNGGAGNDYLDGGAGADTLIGGDGTDTASYASATAGVKAYLDTPNKNMGDASGDTYSSIENLTGSSHNDTLVGDKFANLLVGGDGSDIISGGAGNDTLLGGNGDDVLAGNAGNDRLEGGRGNDMLSGGGSGKDVFAFSAPSWGHDTITDFSDKADLLDMRGSGLTFGSLDIAQQGNDVLISTHDHSSSILIENITTAHVSAADFIFG